jgi:hypothetical protein
MLRNHVHREAGTDPPVANLDEGSGSLPLFPPQKGSIPFQIHYTVPIYAFNRINSRPIRLLGQATDQR